jgi:DNA-binding NarL/FixJ family response regulator
MMDMFKILIIDSSTHFRESLAKSLCARFPEVKIQKTGTGTEGLCKIDAFAPHLIFFDIHLPDISSFDFARKIKAVYPETTLATFTSFDSSEYPSAAAACGVEYLIPKDDWSGNDILSLVETLLTNRLISRRAKAEKKPAES